MCPDLGIKLLSGTRLWNSAVNAIVRVQPAEKSGTFPVFKPVLLSTFETIMYLSVLIVLIISHELAPLDCWLVKQEKDLKNTDSHLFWII